jgi:hypothetical protein
MLTMTVLFGTVVIGAPPVRVNVGPLGAIQPEEKRFVPDLSRIPHAIPNRLAGRD